MHTDRQTDRDTDAYTPPQCDEHHPACHNCIKRGIKCDFLRQDSPSTPVSAPASIELELLHNWTVSTASTLSTNPLVRDVYRVQVPQIGFATRYVLDGLLGLSALHMARYSASRRDMFLSVATQYHTASLNEALPLIPSITPQNGCHLFIFGVLTLFTNLASPIKEDDMLLVGGGFIPEWLFLLRGIDPLILADEDAIFSSAASLIFRTNAVTSHYWSTHRPVESPELDDLAEGIRTRSAADVVSRFRGGNGREGAEDEGRRDVLLGAVDALRRSYTFRDHEGFNDHDKLRGYYKWLFEISDEYLALLREADSDALCVLAYYSVLLRDLEKYWWMQGWSTHLMKRIYLMLDEVHRLSIRWPIEELGWIPDSG